MPQHSLHSAGRIRMQLVVATTCLLVAVSALVYTSAQSEEPASKECPPAAENESQAAERKKLHQEMNARIGKIKVAPVDAPKQTGELVASPLMSYSDELLSINAATLWAWTQPKDGRPIAVCKVEHYDMARRAVPSAWLYCFVSLSGDLLHADWPDGHEWTARRPGITFREMPDAPVPGETPAARLRQMKDLSRRFTAAFEFGKGTQQELRLLTQPVYSYADAEAGIVEGAVFAAAVNGTNPTALFLIELQKDGDRQLWKFAVAAMTDAGVVVKWDDKEVWSKPMLHAPGKDFETWTYFFEKPTAE